MFTASWPCCPYLPADYLRDQTEDTSQSNVHVLPHEPILGANCLTNKLDRNPNTTRDSDADGNWCPPGELSITTASTRRTCYCPSSTLMSRHREARGSAASRAGFEKIHQGSFNRCNSLVIFNVARGTSEDTENSARAGRVGSFLCNGTIVGVNTEQ